jgi:hypothetical protein
MFTPALLGSTLIRPRSGLLALASALGFVITSASVHASSPDRATLDKIANLSVPFVPNGGQWDGRAAFAAQTFAGTLFVTKDGELVYSLPGKQLDVGAGLSTPQSQHEATPSRCLHKPSERGSGWVLSETLVDAKGKPRSMAQSTLKAPAGFIPVEGKVSYTIGNDPSKHVNNLLTFERVNLGDMYPGVNVQLRATDNNVEKIFTVAPKHDPKQIRIALKGAEKLEIGNDGELIVHTGNGPVAFTAPIAFQETASGDKEYVAVEYALDASSSTYGFAVGHYNTARALVIDPIIQSTYLGATSSETALAIAIHPGSGDVYVAGFTASATNSFPGVIGGMQSNYGGGFYDAFVSRFSADLKTRIQSTYLGAAGLDRARALAIHPATGEVYTAGDTSSSTTTFPGVNGGAQSVNGGGIDAFVSRFSADLITLIQSTYLGSSGTDDTYALAIHPITGEIYVTGETTSSTTPFPGVSGGAQSSNGGGTDAFVSRLSADLTTLFRSSYLGASGRDVANAIAIRPATGDIYVVGQTGSIASTFPAVSGGAQGSNAGGASDAFVSRFSTDLTTLIQSTYLGSSLLDSATSLAIHPTTGDIYVAGITDSSTTAFPGVSGGAQASPGGFFDAYVSHLSTDLTTLFRSTYLGASASENANSLVVHPLTAEVYIVGITSNFDFPGVGGGAQASKGLGNDAFAARFSADLTKLMQSTFLGGAGNEQAYALAIHPVSGDIYVAGDTNFDSSFPNVGGGAQAVFGGASDAFLTRVSPDLTALDTTPDAFDFLTQVDVPVNSVRTSNSALVVGIAGAAKIYIEGATDSSYCISSTDGCSCDVSSGFVSTPATIANNRYVCVRHTSANALDAVTQTNLHIGGMAAKFLVRTGSVSSPCNLDMDGDTVVVATKEGLALLRSMLGVTGSATTAGTGITEAQWVAASPAIIANIDMDGDTLLTPQKEGVVLIRAMLGIAGFATTVGSGITPSQWATARLLINAGCGTNFAP